MLRASLKTKMTVAVCFIIACLMTGSAFFALNFFESRIRQSIFETQSTFVSRLADELDEKINDFQKHLIGMAMTFPTDVLQDPEMTQRYLDGRVDASFVFDNAITVLSSSGRLIAEHPYVPDSRGTDFSSHGYFRKTIETGMPYISSPYFPSKEEHSPAIMFAVPVFGKKGEIAALLCGSVSLLNHSYFVKLRGVRVGGTGYTYVYDKDRTMVVHPDEKRMGTRDVPVGANKLFDAALAGFEGTGETVTSKGLHVLASFKRLKNVDWIVASNYPVESAYAPLHEARNVFYFLIVAVVVITMTIVWYLMRRLTQPLDAFAEHVRRLPEKKSSEMLFHGKTGDEIETLSDAFNAMVTEMVGKTEALRQSESRYEKAEDIARIGNWQLAVAAGTMSWSSGMYRILGLQSHEFDATLDAFVRCIHPEDRAAFRNSLDGALGKKTGYDIEHRICRPDGAVLFVRNEAEVVLDEKGTPVLVTGNIRDITRRKRNEEALQRSRDFYLTLLEGFPALIWQSGADSLFNFFNRTWLDFTGRSFEQEAGYGWTEQIHPDDREAFLGSYRGAFQSRMPFEAEFRLRRKDGEYRWIVTAGRAFNDVDGSFAGFIGFCYDITYRKNIEGELRKLFRAVEQNPASIVITDTNGTIEYVNPKFCE
ncbi:MAG: multi-sensor signal transduction histidine kinase, partial [Nitrospirae bacterium]